jgi:hypothetical protein
MWEISWPAEDLLVSQEGLCGTELDSLVTSKREAVKLKR